MPAKTIAKSHQLLLHATVIVVTCSYKLLNISLLILSGGWPLDAWEECYGQKLYKTEAEVCSVLKHFLAHPIFPGLSFLTRLTFDMHYIVS